MKGLPFNLDEAFIKKVFAPGVCAYCETPVLHGQTTMGRGRGGARPNTGELDRIDPVLGYVKGNVVLSCHRCNTYKNDMTPQELRLLAGLADRIEALQRSGVIRY